MDETTASAEAFHVKNESSKAFRMDCLQRLALLMISCKTYIEAISVPFTHSRLVLA